MVDDPFGAADLRAAVLDAWAASPTRFREDANAEEDLVRGGYRDRLVVELVQNALDANAPEPARVAISLTAEALLVANSGRPLTTEGVTALASLRASAKRDDEHAVGRFGVGFAAVLAITDTPMIASISGAVSFSAGRTRSLVGAIPGLGAELTRRDGGVPILRLPFEVAEVGADVQALFDEGWTTVVRLPFRDVEAAELSNRLLAELDPVLAVVIDGLAEVRLPDRRITRTVLDGGDVEVDGVRWRVARRDGSFSEAEVSGLPAEGRRRSWWTLAAVSVDEDGGVLPLPAGVTSVLRAPQETHEQHSFPMVLAGSFELDPDRRRLREDATQGRLLTELAATVTDLALKVSPTPAVLDLLPVGLPAGPQDSALRGELEEQLRTAPLFPDAKGGRRSGADSQVLDLGHATMVAQPILAEVSGAFLPPQWPSAHNGYRALGVGRVDTRRLVDWLVQLPSRPEPSWWRRLAVALVDAPDHDALGSLPVPLADGSFAIGPRGVLVADEGFDLTPLVEAGVPLRVLHPDAADPAWVRLGVTVADATTILRDERLAAAVLEQARALRDEDLDPEPSLAEGILQLVAASGQLDVGSDQLSWLGQVVLRAADGSAWPARDLLLPQSPLRDLLTDPLVVAADILDRHGHAALVALGVADGFAVVDLQTALEDESVSDDEVSQWERERLGHAIDLHGAQRIEAIRDLDLIRADRWPETLTLLAADPRTRRAVLHVDVSGQSFAAWQIARLATIGGRGLREHSLSKEPAVAAILPTLPVDLDLEFASALGVPTSLADLLSDRDAGWDLLDRMGDAEVELERPAVRALYTRLAESLAGQDGDPPLSVRAVVAGALQVVPTDEAVILDAPDLIPLIGARPYVPVAMSSARALATLLRIHLASELGAYEIVSAGADRMLGERAYVHHDELEVTDADGVVQRVSWRVPNRQSGAVHATGADGLGRAWAFLDGEWAQREAYVARLRDPSLQALHSAESDLEEPADPR